jgi:hypothetical protein
MPRAFCRQAWDDCAACNQYFCNVINVNFFADDGDLSQELLNVHMEPVALLLGEHAV